MFPVPRPKSSRQSRRQISGPASPYGDDPWTKRARAAHGNALRARRVGTPSQYRIGSQCPDPGVDGAALGGIYCHRDAHINIDECGAPDSSPVAPRSSRSLEPMESSTGRPRRCPGPERRRRCTPASNQRPSASPNQPRPGPSTLRPRSNHSPTSRTTMACGSTWMARGSPTRRSARLPPRRHHVARRGRRPVVWRDEEWRGVR